MKNLKLSSLCLVLPVISGLALSAVSGQAQSASATISGVPVTGGYNYTITLGNAGSALAPGNSATFTFFSTSTPVVQTTSPAGDSVAYVNGIDFSQGAPGDSTPVFTPTLVAAPEPASVGLLAIG